jgi:hypothetical protein
LDSILPRNFATLPAPQSACRGLSSCTAKRLPGVIELHREDAPNHWKMGQICLLPVREGRQSSLSSKRQINSEDENDLW